MDFLLLVGQEEWDNDCGFSNAIIAAPRSPTLVSAEIVANLVFWSSGMRKMQCDGCTANLERLLTMLTSALNSGCFYIMRMIVVHMQAIYQLVSTKNNLFMHCE